MGAQGSWVTLPPRSPVAVWEGVRCLQGKVELQTRDEGLPWPHRNPSAPGGWGVAPSERTWGCSDPRVGASAAPPSLPAPGAAFSPGSVLGPGSLYCGIIHLLQVFC